MHISGVQFFAKSLQLKKQKNFQISRFWRAGTCDFD
jgi:hypothetical protein